MQQDLSDISSTVLTKNSSEVYQQTKASKYICYSNIYLITVMS